MMYILTIVLIVIIASYTLYRSKGGNNLSFKTDLRGKPLNEQLPYRVLGALISIGALVSLFFIDKARTGESYSFGHTLSFIIILLVGIALFMILSRKKK